MVDGCEFTPYLPFVLISAFMLRWWQAGLVALASVATLGLVFMGRPSDFLGSACFQSGAGIFLASSAAMIGLVAAIRSVILAIQSRGVDEEAGGIIFSLDRGQVWASWYGQGPPILLGSERKVTTMMQDYLAQVEFGKRLNSKFD